MPGANLVSQLFFHQFHPEFAEVLRMGRTVQPELHSDLHHNAAKHECWVCAG